MLFDLFFLNSLQTDNSRVLIVLVVELKRQILQFHRVAREEGDEEEVNQVAHDRCSNRDVQRKQNQKYEADEERDEGQSYANLVDVVCYPTWWFLKV